MLTTASAAAIRESSVARDRLLRSAEVMARFYGFAIATDGAEWSVRPSDAFAERRRVWLSRGNHNFLRQTRIMRSLMALGHAPLARAWFRCLAGIYAADSETIGTVTFRHWTAAVGDEL